MKTTQIFIAILLVSAAAINAQDKLAVPELDIRQKQEVLYQHVMAYSLTGVDFAKSQGTSPKEYGSYVGEQFRMFWNPEDGIEVFSSRMMYILAGLHPANAMEILEQGPDKVSFRLKNVDMSFREGPAFGVTYQEYLDFSEGVIASLAEYLGLGFSHAVNGEWYEVTVTTEKLTYRKSKLCCPQR